MNADAILLVGSNPRWEASVLNARIRKAFINNNCKVGLIGPALDLNYAYDKISESLDELNDILDNQSEFSEVLFNAKNPIIIIGTSAINTSEGSSVLKTCAEIAKKLPQSTLKYPKVPQSTLKYPKVPKSTQSIKVPFLPIFPPKIT